MGGDIEVFRGGRYRGFFGGDKVLRGKKTESRVQSPESRVQGPGSSPAFRICPSSRLYVFKRFPATPQLKTVYVSLKRHE